MDNLFRTELTINRYSKIERLWILFAGFFYTTIILVALVGVIFYLNSLPQLLNMTTAASGSVGLLLLYPLKLSINYFVKGIRGYSYTTSMVMEKRTEEIDQWLEVEKAKQQNNRGAVNSSTRSLAKLFTLWGSISRIVIIWLFAIMVCKSLPLEELSNKPMLEFSLKDVGAIIAAMNVLAISGFWIGLIDRKTQEEKEVIYSGWGWLSLTAILLQLTVVLIN